MKKLITTVLAAVFILAVNATGVYAVDFDPIYYAQRYPDVANTIGCGEKALYEHYLNIGQKEGRYPNALAECEGHARQIELQNAKAKGNTAAENQPAVTQNTAAPQTPAVTANTIASTAALTGTYVDVNIASQTMTLFVNGIPALSSPCVTGTPRNNRSTPTGAFYIMEKIPGKRLKGDTWDVWVDRWMRFTSDSCGLHEASWRRKFGGNIYKSNGSHGCVNLPKDVAYKLYDMVAVGTPVIVH